MQLHNSEEISIEVELDEDEIFLPVFDPLRQPGYPLRLSYGGRDSGKSRDAAMRKLLSCLFKPYFRCILIKKTLRSIKDSQWKLLKDLAEKYGIDQFFNFTTNPMEIHCVNGNSFLCRGMDEPANIKSISEPSEVWIEEANQLDLDDWIYIITTVRSSEVDIPEIDLTFNTETPGIDFNEHWLYKQYFKHTKLKSFTDVLRMEVGDEVFSLPYIAIHTTYHDNPYVTPIRKAFHEQLAKLSPYWYNIFTLGNWGNDENDKPWLFTWNERKHMSPVELKATREHPLILSWDFNRNPMACTVMQDYYDPVRQCESLKIIQVFKIPKVGVEGICRMILTIYPDFIYKVTGDYSGDVASTFYEEEVTNYTMIQKLLDLADAQIEIQPNPDLRKNQTLVNYFFAHYDVQVCPVKAQPFKYDAENVRKDAEGKIEKKDRKDPKQQADVLDTVRYYINNEHADMLDKLT